MGTIWRYRAESLQSEDADLDCYEGTDAADGIGRVLSRILVM